MQEELIDLTKLLQEEGIKECILIYSFMILLID